MKLHLSALKVHLAHCAVSRSIRRNVGVVFTESGVPKVAALPVRH
ncbi:MAG: hypothetical protein H6R10_724 [Rhodocyclaceae bacterium]|nr:hypothetical protein [Rhodocyclaceae bacterium]